VELGHHEAGRNGGSASSTHSRSIGKQVIYKVIEISLVTDETLEEQLNTWSGRGWQFESIHFVVRENSRRPAMAFVFFVRERDHGSD
jgi:hypothetical protein